ncbi:CpsD/CapB family tyrosine-protein kinase [Pseudalkalibacillus hwajinpoensis]|uniref:CpsD/CapB family tyrosine-protein kinase n=1 Tax=Guptibacillus hwajinpoensis TaxID=208199 RepID=A0A4V5Q1R5_9BACL|nr:CpsD/CapB family tyrosine-protein kinase [Pseudalkalibacillus hwajinpoensis]TKD70808.1 CpsD/CapB family tyrosine-protein kinase [Pseudalkalibacillus hwajinpoensis]
MRSLIKEKLHSKAMKEAARHRLRANQIKVIRSEIEKNSNMSHRSILITTPDHSLSDSFVSLDLAKSYADQGKNTILIDGNFSGPVLHKWLDEKITFGLTNALHRGNVARYVHPTKIKNLSFLPLGTSSVNQIDSWRMENLNLLKQQLRSISDVTVIESPSYLTYLEIQLLAEVCDDVIVVVKQHRDKKSRIRQLKKDMEAAGIEITGMVYQPR